MHFTRVYCVGSYFVTKLIIKEDVSVQPPGVKTLVLYCVLTSSVRHVVYHQSLDISILLVSVNKTLMGKVW